MITKSKFKTGMTGNEAIKYLSREIQRYRIKALASDDDGEKLFLRRRMLQEERKLKGLLNLTGAGRYKKNRFAMNSIIEYR